MKLYTDLTLVDKKRRGEIADILLQLVNDRTIAENISVYGAQVAQYHLVDEIEMADVCVLPMRLLHMMRQGQFDRAQKFVHQAQLANKPIAIWTGGGDYGLRVPFDNVWTFGRSGYQSRRLARQHAIPAFVWDSVTSAGLDEMQLRDWTPKPKVGFCGQAKDTLTTMVGKVARAVLHNTRVALRRTPYEQLPLRPPTQLRARALDILARSPDVETAFIRHVKYRAGVRSAKEKRASQMRFFQNIIDSDYTVCVRGTGNYSTRLYETLSMGRIPIFVNTDSILPLDQWIDWRDLCVWVEQDEIDQLPAKLLAFHARFDPATFHAHQRRCRDVWQANLSYAGYFSQFPKLFSQ